MALTDGTKAAHLEGIIRSISKEIYGKGPRNIRCTCQGDVFLVRCTGVLSPVERGLAEHGPDGVVTLRQVRSRLFEKERELIKKQFDNSQMQIVTILQDLYHDKDKRLLVILTEAR